MEPRPLPQKPEVPDDPKYVKLLAPVRKVQIWLNETPTGKKVKTAVLTLFARFLSK